MSDADRDAFETAWLTRDNPPMLPSIVLALPHFDEHSYLLDEWTWEPFGDV